MLKKFMKMDFFSYINIGEIMKKTKKYTITILLTIFSFYYINHRMVMIRNNDPIMKQIKMNKSYEKKSINATIIGKNIITGENGRVIDYNKSYNNMKKYGAYNETLIEMKEVSPTISITNNYNKYIIKGNPNKRKISLILIIKDRKENYLSILNNKNIPVTIFIDGTFLENNISFIKKEKTHHEFELLSYNNEYNEKYFKTSLFYLETITNKKSKYCYSEIDNEEILSLCNKLKLHTIKPSLLIKNNLYKNIKQNLSNGKIFTIEYNSYNEKELSTTLDYIIQKGYKIVTLENLLKESLE